MLFEVWSGLDHQLTLHMDPNTKLHQFKAYNSVLSVEKALALQAWVELLKYKAQLCIQGNQMYEGLKEGEGTKETSSYSPVIDWGTLQIILLTIQYDLCMTQVDFEKAFVQAPLKRPMYMNLIPGLNDAPHLNGKTLCMLDWVKNYQVGESNPTPPS